MFSQDMDGEGFVLNGEAYRLLGGIALLGIEAGLHDVAQRMAADLQALRPDLPHGTGIVAMGQVARGLGREAIQTLEACLVQFPDFQLGKSLLAICMAEVGRPGWQTLLEEVIEDARDEHAVALACAVLGRANPYADMGSKELSSKEASARPEVASHALWV